jgi:hypothetical protein
MKRKTLVVALAFAASLLLATNGFAQSAPFCTGGTNLKFVGVGSSAQINALGYAAANLELAAHGAYALYTFKSSTIVDSRAGTTDTGLTTFVVWDPTASGPCDTYVYFQTDSGVGDKDFFAYEKFTASASTVTAHEHFNSIGAAYATVPTGTGTAANVIKGMTDGCWLGTINGAGSGSACTGGSTVNQIPSTISTALNINPATYVNQATPPAAPSYCGNVSTVTITSQYYCYFNAAGTDVRPEDELYATTRALATYNGIVPPATHGGTLTGLGYGGATLTSGSAGCTGGTTLVGCPFIDSFNQGSEFFVAKWAVSGTDPIKSGTLPSYTTLAVGAVPVVIIAGNEDTANLGHTFTDGAGKTNYTYNNINRQVLAQIYQGYTACLGDIQAGSAGTGSTGADIPLQVVQREALSGTYNTFEFTGVRTQQGGPLLSTATPNANADSGQEQFNDPSVFPGHFSASDCTYAGTINSLGVAYPQSNCFNPLFLSHDGTNIKSGSKCTGASGGTAPGLPVRLRAIGTGQLVKAVAGLLNKGASTSGSTTVFNPIGYSFAGYANLGTLCSTITGTSCSSWLGHYLTVDGIDPLFTTPGGEFDSTPNPSGPFNPPVCDFTVACPVVPFTHIKDGGYPLWSILRTVTFAPVAGKLVTPPAVLDMIANEEIAAGCTGSGCTYLGDYTPFLTGVTGSNGVYTGNLNLFVYRSHFKQTGGTINPSNGHTACAGSFTGVSLQGGTHTSSTCLVDFGNDVGGAVLTVESDVDFIADFGVEEYGIRQ